MVNTPLQRPAAAPSLPWRQHSPALRARCARVVAAAKLPPTHEHEARQSSSAPEAQQQGGEGAVVPSVAGKRVAVLQATKSSAVAVEELQRSLADYMTLPASQYSVLDAKRIERLDADTFRCHVGGLRFLRFQVEPVLTLSVIVGEAGPTVRLLSTKLRGSKAVEAANDRFTATMTNVVTWRRRQGGESGDGGGGKEIASDTSIQVTLEVPPWFVVPTAVIERAGCALMARVLDTAVPRFLAQLKADYELWALGSDQRRPAGEEGQP